jgi:hypothetical protein
MKRLTSLLTASVSFIIFFSITSAYAQTLPNKTETTSTLTSTTNPIRAVSLTTTAPASSTDTGALQPLTPEAPPVTTQEPAAPSTNTSPTKTTQQNPPHATTSQETNHPSLPEPVLPILDINATTETPSNKPVPETPQPCLNQNETKAKIIAPVVSNQIKVALITLLSALMGSLLWIAGSALIISTRARRDLLHLKNLSHQQRKDAITKSLQKTKETLSATLDSILAINGNKQTLDQKQLSTYLKSAANLEIFSSQTTLQAHKNLVRLLSNQPTPSLADIAAAKSTLINSLQNDIMGESPAA